MKIISAAKYAVIDYTYAYSIVYRMTFWYRKSNSMFKYFSKIGSNTITKFKICHESNYLG